MIPGDAQPVGTSGLAARWHPGLHHLQCPRHPSIPMVSGQAELSSSWVPGKGHSLEASRSRKGRVGLAKTPLHHPPSPEGGQTRSWAAGGAHGEGTVLLYLKCFLTSFPVPGRGAASLSWGGRVPTRALPLSWGSPAPSAACHLPLHQPHPALFPPPGCPVPSCAAFKLFILYLWFGAPRKVLPLCLSPC